MNMSFWELQHELQLYVSALIPTSWRNFVKVFCQMPLIVLITFLTHHFNELVIRHFSKFFTWHEIWYLFFKFLINFVIVLKIIWPIRALDHMIHLRLVKFSWFTLFVMVPSFPNKSVWKARRSSFVFNLPLNFFRVRRFCICQIKIMLDLVDTMS